DAFQHHRGAQPGNGGDGGRRGNAGPGGAGPHGRMRPHPGLALSPGNAGRRSGRTNRGAGRRPIDKPNAEESQDEGSMSNIGDLVDDFSTAGEHEMPQAYHTQSEGSLMSRLSNGNLVEKFRLLMGVNLAIALLLAVLEVITVMQSNYSSSVLSTLTMLAIVALMIVTFVATRTIFDFTATLKRISSAMGRLAIGSTD